MNSLIVYLLFFYTFGVKCLHTILAKKRAFLRLIFTLTHTHTQKILAHHPLVSESKDRTSGADPGFFLGVGALVSCSTSTPMNHIVFFSFAEYQLY